MHPTFKPLRACIGKAALTLAVMIFIFFGCLNSSYSQLPLSTGAPYVGQKAPSFTLPDQGASSAMALSIETTVSWLRALLCTISMS